MHSQECILHVISDYCTLNWEKCNNGTSSLWNHVLNFTKHTHTETLQGNLFILRVSDISGVSSNDKYWACSFCLHLVIEELTSGCLKWKKKKSKRNGGTKGSCLSCYPDTTLLGELKSYKHRYKGKERSTLPSNCDFFFHTSLAIPDESTKGIASLVAKQRSNHKVRNSMPKGRTSVCSGPSPRRRVPYRGRVPPILPAVVKSELKDLLALSPVLLSDFEKAFARRFGRSFQYVQYGFFSLFEVLNAASDVVSVEQTRAGSLLTLRKSISEEKQKAWPAGKHVSMST